MKKISFPLIAALCFGIHPFVAGQVIVNEFISSNQTINADQNGDYGDWIELHNGGTETVSLHGYGLTDTPAQPFKWIFPDINIEPDGYLVIWCSDKNQTDPSQPLHTNFKIAAQGETIVLTSSAGVTLSTMPAVALTDDISYGIVPLTGLAAYFQEPTPGAANLAVPFSEILQPVAFSATSGFYTSGFNLALSHPDPFATIFYTLDGSDPNPAHLAGVVYSYKNQYPELPLDTFGELLSKTIATLSYALPIPIQDRSAESDKLSHISTTLHQSPYYFPSQPVFKGTVVKACAVKPGAISSSVTSNSYFITPQGSARYSLPVVSLSTDERGLFDYYDGLHVAGKDFDDWRMANPSQANTMAAANYTRTGNTAEIEGNLIYFANGQPVLNHGVQIRIHGAFSRSFPNKSLRIYANDTFEYSFFQNNPSVQFDTFILRNAGNDVSKTFFRDAMIQKINTHLDVAIQDYQPAVMLVNGEYWGLLNIRERYDGHYFERHFNLPETALDLLEYDGSIVQEGSNSDYVDMMAFLLSHNLSDQANYDHVLTRIDSENFTDYFIANIYAANNDWPHNNISFWRKRTPFTPNAPEGHDGRWRWVLKDMDFGFGGNNLPEAWQMDMLAIATSSGELSPIPEWSTRIIRSLLENPIFKNHFINRFADLMNTAYLPQRVNGIIDQMKSAIEPEMAEHWQRWNNTSSIENWHLQVGIMKDFATQRPAFQRDHIRTKFDIAQNIAATLDCDDLHGFVKINTIEIKPSTPGVAEHPYPWNGIYFSGIPITLKAVALPGFEFSHWSGASNSTNPEITLTPEADFAITAHFMPSENPADRVPIYFWMIDNTVANDLPLTGVGASYELAGQAVLEYQSALDGYPFASEHPLWRKASLERRNAPTEINYLPEVNNNEPFADSDMRGLQVKQPFQAGNRENTMIFHLPTTGYKDIQMAFAAKDENAADAILLDYSIADTPEWITDGLPLTTLPLIGAYQLYTADFSLLDNVEHNPDFKVRLRFSGTDMSTDNGDRVTFNNVSVTGIAETLGAAAANAHRFAVYPNPVDDKLFLVNPENEPLAYRIYALDGRLMDSGYAATYIGLALLQPGVYVLEMASGHRTEAKKIIKK